MFAHLALPLTVLLTPSPAPATPPRATTPASPAAVAASTSQLAQMTLVLPLAASGEAEPEWLSQGAAEFISEGLAAAGYRLVDGQTREDALSEVGLADEKRLTLASACEVARRVGARYVITGKWDSEGSKLGFTARVIDAEHVRQIRSSKASGHLTLLGPTLATLVVELAGESARVPAARTRIEALGATRQEVLLAWMQAASEPEMAGEHLKAALDVLPAFAPARLALAEARIDGGEPETVGRLLLLLPPDAAEHHRARGRLLEGRAMLAMGDTHGAVLAMQEATRLRPQPDWLLWLAEAQLADNQPEAAKTTARQVLEALPADQHALELVEQADGGALPEVE